MLANSSKSCTVLSMVSMIRTPLFLGLAIFSGIEIVATTACFGPAKGDTALADAGAQDGPDQFIAFSDDFTGFQNWPSVFLGEGSDVSGIHVPGPKTVFINKIPPKGSTTFPVG